MRELILIEIPCRTSRWLASCFFFFVFLFTLETHASVRNEILSKIKMRTHTNAQRVELS